MLDDAVMEPSQLRSGLPAGLDAIVLRGLDRAQERRFESARAMALELEAVVRPATAVEVGEWVKALAAVPLASRREKVARMDREADAAPLAAAGADSPTGGGSTAAIPTLVEIR